jgi:hypothetical protein
MRLKVIKNKSHGLKNNYSRAQWLKPVILVTQEVDGGWEDGDSRPPGEKIWEIPISANTSWAWWCAPVIPATREA